MTPKPGSTIAVWFSCGAPSTVAAQMTLLKYGETCRVRIVNNPVDEEGEDNRRYLSDAMAWLNHPIEQAINSSLGHTSAERIWWDRNYMSGPKGAPCTGQLKKAARYEWEATHRPDYHVFGFTVEEKHRQSRISRELLSIPVLIDAGMTREACFDVIQKAGLLLPEAYRKGYPNANCCGCVKATSATYWQHVRRADPEVFAARATLSRILGTKLVRYKNVRMYLDELPTDATGRPLRSAPDCGILCDTKERSKK